MKKYLSRAAFRIDHGESESIYNESNRKKVLSDVSLSAGGEVTVDGESLELRPGSSLIHMDGKICFSPPTTSDTDDKERGDSMEKATSAPQVLEVGKVYYLPVISHSYLEAVLESGKTPDSSAVVVLDRSGQPQLVRLRPDPVDGGAGSIESYPAGVAAVYSNQEDAVVHGISGAVDSMLEKADRASAIVQRYVDLCRNGDESKGEEH